ncbi:MAG: hypothetical protein NTY23_14340, partial [Chloroflexi bacterium]|nr:hypothetical protein [Chloroflexota bacterium]
MSSRPIWLEATFHFRNGNRPLATALGNHSHIMKVLEKPTIAAQRQDNAGLLPFVIHDALHSGFGHPRPLRGDWQEAGADSSYAGPWHMMTRTQNAGRRACVTIDAWAGSAAGVGLGRRLVHRGCGR